MLVLFLPCKSAFLDTKYQIYYVFCLNKYLITTTKYLSQSKSNLSPTLLQKSFVHVEILLCNMIRKGKVQGDSSFTARAKTHF
jgi:hypothetical protein